MSGEALVELALLAAIRDDRDALGAIAARQTGRPDWERALVARWVALFDGVDAPPISAPPGDPTITATAQDALFLLEQRDLEAAKKAARRANRMARSDGLVFQEYLTSLVLARVRRYDHKPHLGLRILSDLARVAPVPWQGWIRWEQVFSGAEELLPVESQGVVRLLDLLAAASAGERGAFEAKSRSADAAVRSAHLQRELDVLRNALDPLSDPDVELAPWASGETNTSPGSLSGLVVPRVDETGEERAAAMVYVAGGRARRVLSRGAALAAVGGGDVTYALSQARTYHLIAELALATDWIPVEDVFARVYGFTYEPARHGTVLRMLLHRARTALPTGAEIARDEAGALRLRTAQPMLSPDPRCTLDLDALVLRALAARSGRASAQELAESLGVSARTVQHALRDLLDDGSCELVKVGRAVTYKLEDTTFWEPTLERLHPRGID